MPEGTEFPKVNLLPYDPELESLTDEQLKTHWSQAPVHTDEESKIAWENLKEEFTGNTVNPKYAHWTDEDTYIMTPVSGKMIRENRKTEYFSMSILNSISRTTAYLSSVDKQDFFSSLLTQTATVPPLIEKLRLSVKMEKNDVYDEEIGREEAGPVEKAIFEKITNDFKEIKYIEVTNKSADHKGEYLPDAKHRDEAHFHVGIISSEFEGQSLVCRQRRINKLLQHEFDEGLHALTMETKTPGEVQKEQEILENRRKNGAMPE